MGPLTLGPKVPLVTFPISLSFSSNIFVDSLAITFVSGFIPTLSFETPSLYCFLINSEPGNFSLILLFEIAHFRFASIGLVFSSKS